MDIANRTTVVEPDDLDYAFLKYIGVSSEGEAALHSIYLSFLAGHTRILDLGCGFGGFVKLLCEHGHAAYGVDSDPKCIAEARENQLEVVEADVVEHLRTLPAESLDAIFSAHMVEHMPYQVVLETIQLAHRALKPGGRLLLVTPNPRALVTHLELYHMHFGHIALYHPKLLAFFMEYSGFSKTETGENPHTSAAKLVPDSPLRTLADLPGKLATWAEFRPNLHLRMPPKPAGFLARMLWNAKVRIVPWLFEPFLPSAFEELKRLSSSVDERIASVQTNIDLSLSTMLESIDRPFECYVIGDKKQP